MSRTFAEDERVEIRQRLLDAGRALFTTQGLKKTSLEELTRPAGIAKSSFYLFFGSKEALYLELLAQEGPRVERQLLSPLSGDDARAAIDGFLRAVIRELETNPLTRRLLTHPEELRMVARRVTPQEMEAKLEHGVLPIVDFVRQGQERGRIVGGKPEVIGGVIRAVSLLTLHRDEIGEDIYPEVLDLLIRLVAEGLTKSMERSAGG